VHAPRNARRLRRVHPEQASSAVTLRFRLRIPERCCLGETHDSSRPEAVNREGVHRD
jgi:hypothetical protein